MFRSGRYLYVMYMCHLAVEKFLKALVAERQDQLPPKTHNLYQLVQRAELEIIEEYRQLIADLNAASLPVRYPEDLQALSREYTKETTEGYLKKTQECIAWLKQHPSLRPL